jgi:hypothetical protein
LQGHLRICIYAVIQSWATHKALLIAHSRKVWMKGKEFVHQQRNVM